MKDNLRDSQLFDSVLALKHPLCKEIVWSLVEEKAGVYLISHEKSVVYVGRSDKNLRRRLLQHCANFGFKGHSFSFRYADSKVAAYRLESRAIHYFKRLGVLKNRINASLPNS